ncbi:MAG: hypothetical protein JWM14_1375 [Chitinophagaceae bacterium]|nr:hypothetical protein [Chitinophagaceae bacterium]
MYLLLMSLVISNNLIKNQCNFFIECYYLNLNGCNVNAIFRIIEVYAINRFKNKPRWKSMSSNEAVYRFGYMPKKYNVTISARFSLWDMRKGSMNCVRDSSGKPTASRDDS